MYYILKLIHNEDKWRFKGSHAGIYTLINSIFKEKK